MVVNKMTKIDISTYNIVTDEQLEALNNIKNLTMSVGDDTKGLIKTVNDIENLEDLVLKQKIIDNLLDGMIFSYITSDAYNRLSEEEKNRTDVRYEIIDEDVLMHNHDNKDILDRISVDNNKLLFDNQQLSLSININDTNNYFTSDNLNDVLQEIGLALSQLKSNS